MSQTAGLSLQCLGPVEAGWKGPVELYADLSPPKPACLRSVYLLGKTKVLGMPSDAALIPATV